MDPADINTTERTLVRRAVTQSEQVSWNSLVSCEVCRLPSLFDEAGIVFHTDSGALYVRETQPGYAELFDAVKLARHLPNDWYSAVEAGESFRVNLDTGSESGRD